MRKSRKKCGIRLEFGIGICIITFLFLMFRYEDLQAWTVWSLNLLDVTYEHRIWEFYSYSAQNLHNIAVQYVGWNFIALIPWAIWNIPIWILQYFFKMDIFDYPLMMLWSHLFLVLVLYLAYKLFWKIGNLFGADTSNISNAASLFVLSPFVYIGVSYSAQTDIISIVVFLLSLYLLMKKEKRKFYLCAMLGFLIKPFLFLSHIAIILLEEKNLIKAVAKIVGLMSFSWIFSLIFYHAPMYRFSQEHGPSGRMLQEILGRGISAVNEITVSIFVILLVVIYFSAYIVHVDEENRNQYIFYFSLLPMLVYFMCLPFEHYRLLILAPLLSLVLLNHSEYFQLNIVLITLINASGLICDIAGSSYMLNLRFIKGSVMEKILSPMKTINYVGGIRSNMLQIFPYFDAIAQAAAAIFCAAAMFFIIFNLPQKKWENSLLRRNQVNKGLLWINYLMILPVLILTCYNI